MSEDQSNPFKIAIIGGGIGGLFAALSIHYQCQDTFTKNNTTIQDNFQIDIFEQTTEYKEIGIGVSLGANGVNLIRRLGLYDATRSIASISEGSWMSFHRYDNSKEIYTVKLKDV